MRPRRLSFISLEPRRDQGHVRPRPGPLEAGVHGGCLLVLPLRAERLREPEQGPAVLGESAEILAIDPLGLGGLPRLQIRGAERVPDRVVPLRRLEVESRLLDLERLAEVAIPSSNFPFRVAISPSGKNGNGHGVFTGVGWGGRIDRRHRVSAACASANCPAAWAPRA
jgi:hypothetical protein